jgi:Ca-activated chloride channel family protein
MRALAVALTLALPSMAGAQGMLLPRCVRPMEDRRPIVSECLPDRPQVVRTRSDVRVELRDRVLRYEVEERFLNRGGLIGEADYVFPLPKGAAFRDLKLSIDGELVAGETMNATDARRIYEDIVRRQKDPALVEWMGHGLLRTRIFPIQPGEERRVVVRFEAVAEREGDAVRVDYFRGSGSGTWAVGSETRSHISHPTSPTSFHLTYRAGGELGEAYSPTHELDVDTDQAVRRVSIRGSGPDVTVLVALRRSLAASVAVLTHATTNEQGYALITVTPPTDLASMRLPRDLTFVIDVSGSMAGRKLEQAKAAGRRLLATLTERDRFRIIDFSTEVNSFRDGYVFATDANVSAANRYLESLEAQGSTNISGALDAALGSRLSADNSQSREPRAEGRIPMVLFMTDGAATVGERDPAQIAARAARMRGETRVFSYGLGADVNIGLIEQLAVEGRGTATFLRPDENVERSVELLATRLRAPLLTDVRVGIDGGANVRLSRMYPTGQQDIFAGQDLVLLARYDGSGPANVIVTGRAGTRTVRWTSERNFAREDRENAFVPRLWATQRIGWLAVEKRRGGGNPEIDNEIRSLGERFGIPTEFTSYLVLEPGMVANAPTQQRAARRDIAQLRGQAGSGASAAAPAAVAFEAAKSSAEQRDAKSLAAADAAVMDENATRGELRRAGSRMFKREGDAWKDLSAKPDHKVYKVQAYSRTYFDLITRIPDLRQHFSVAEKVTVSGKGVVIEVVASAPELSESEIAEIARKW